MSINPETRREFAHAISDLEDKAEALWSLAEDAGFAIAYDHILDNLAHLADNAREEVMKPYKPVPWPS